REERLHRIKILRREGIEFVSWHSQQAIVEPSHAVDTVRTRSAAYLARYSLGCAPPSRVIILRRLKPVATSCSFVAPGSKSPAICSMVNWSNGLFPLNESIT